jgi:PAS domain S-box-containing protein
LVLDLDLKILLANRSFINLFQVTPEETLDKFIYDLGNGQWNIPKLREMLEETLLKNKIFDGYEIEHEFPSIGHKIMLLNARRLIEEKTGFQSILLVIEDISKHKKKYARLEKTLNKLAKTIISEYEVREYTESIINTVREPLIVLDQDLSVVIANSAFYNIFKANPKETLGQHIYELGNKQWDIPKLREMLETILAQSTTFDDYEVVYDFADIGRRTMLLNARQIQRVSEKERTILLAIEDITERRRLEDFLKESEDRYRRIFETASDGIVLLEKCEGKITHANQAIEKMFGYSKEACIGKKLQDLGISHSAIDFHAAMKALDKSAILNYDNIPAKTRDGQTIYTDIFMLDRTGLAQCNIRDITERKKLEDHLQQAQKMEAIGTLAGGIAHDFNNILMSILGYTELAIYRLPQGSDARGNLEEVVKASTRAIDLVKQILTFSRPSEKQLFPTPIHLIVKEALKLLRSSLPSTIGIKQNINASGKVLADPTQIHQIMMNLCTNAAHAMSENGGELSVGLIQVNLPEDNSVPMDLFPGPYLKLTVGDTGCGMTPDVLNRIFEPYFTTKGKDKGTGLGLAVVQGIVKNHDGLITIDSDPGKGSAFHVYLPMIIDSGENKKPVRAVETIFTGTERILFVDDEPTIIKMSKEMLESLGYEVVVKSSGVEALELFMADPDQFDLIITDMTMPHMTGAQLSKQLLEIRPDIRIILCSGFSEKISEETAKKIGIREFVIKPISRQVLSKIIRTVLDAPKNRIQD